MRILKAEIGTVNGMTLQAEIKDGIVDLWTWPSGQEEVIAGHIKLSVEDIKELLGLLNQLLEG